MTAKKKAKRQGPPDPQFLSVVGAFAQDKAVSLPGSSKGFGAQSLKVHGKIFAMMFSKGRFVVKLPRVRVTELIASGEADQFDPGHGRLMKEWAVIRGRNTPWVELAKEAYRFVKAKQS